MATRTALTQNFVKSAGTLFEGFSDVGSWTLGGSAATIEADTTLVRSGTESIRFHGAAGSGNRYATKDITLDMSNRDGFWLSFYVASRHVGQSASLTMYMSHQTGLGSGLGRWVQTVTNEFGEGWNLRFIRRSDFDVLDGVPDWALPVLSWRFRIDVDTTFGSDITLDGIYLDDARCYPQICLTFDDGVDTAYTNGFSYSNPAGIRLSHFIIPDAIDTGGNLTTAQIQEMYDAGDDVGLHHQTNFSTLTEPEILITINSVKSALLGKGWSRGNNILSWPNGEYGITSQNFDACYNSAETAGLDMAYTITPMVEPTFLGLNNKWAAKRGIALNNTTSLAQAKTAVDEAISYGGLITAYGHGIDAVADALTWTTSDWEAFIDYVVLKQSQGLITVRTISQFFTKLTGSQRASV